MEQEFTNEISIKIFDAYSKEFPKQFEPYSKDFFSVLSVSYSEFFGQNYHIDRMIDGKAILYAAFHNNILIAASYVKRSGRRGATAVDSNYKNKGIGQLLVNQSLQDIPNQYSILPYTNTAMCGLLRLCGFQYAQTYDELITTIPDELPSLINFDFNDNFITFCRQSNRRGRTRCDLCLIYTTQKHG